jgi:hypothetical protein
MYANICFKTQLNLVEKNLPAIFFICYFVTQSTFNIKIHERKARSVGRTEGNT